MRGRSYANARSEMTVPHGTPNPESFNPNEIADLADRAVSLMDAWLARDPRIPPIVIIGGREDSEESRLRREDDDRRDRARRELVANGQSAAAAIAHDVLDLSPLLKLIDCAQRDDQVKAEELRLDARVFLQQVGLKCRASKAQPQAEGLLAADPVRAECVRIIDHLMAAIEDGSPGRELDAVRPLTWKLEELVRKLGYERVPIRFDRKERGGWWTDVYDTVDPWGGSSDGVFLGKHRLSGAPGDTVREKMEVMENGPTPEQLDTVMRNLRAWRREIISRPGTDVVPQAPPEGTRAGEQKLDVVAVSNSLGDRQRGILLTLFQRRAFDRNTRMLTDEIAKLLDGPDAKPAGFKQPVADLVLQEYVESARGRDGGVWLTAQGRALGEYLSRDTRGQAGAA